MLRDNRPLAALDEAAISWPDDHTPRSELFGDVYYSRNDGMAESRYTFLEGNALAERLGRHGSSAFCVGETGFGTGLNFLLTLEAWLNCAEPRPDLHMISVERWPVSPQDMRRAHAAHATLSPMLEALLAQYPPPFPGCHRLIFASGRVRLDLYYGDANEILEELAEAAGPRVDAWYLDGFAPSGNAEMWQPGLFDSIAALSRPGATLATFTAAGHVRRGLAAAGFDMYKTAGYGRKREALRGQITRAVPRPESRVTPWDIPASRYRRPASALVIGAGLAGCWAAEALASRGVNVTVIDRGEIACGASGNRQGVLYTRLSTKHSILTDFALHSFLFAIRRYARLFADARLAVSRDGAICGMLQLCRDGKELATMQAHLQGLDTLAQTVDAEAASRLVGAAVESGGYWFPSSGWLNPGAVCRALLAHPGINVKSDAGEVTLQQSDDQWRAFSGQQLIAAADCAVVATGADTAGVLHAQSMPLTMIRGQTTQLAKIDGTDTLRAVLCDKGYIAPAVDDEHCIGATFNLHDQDTELQSADHRVNLQNLGNALPGCNDALQALDVQLLDGRVGFRCTSPDYLPIAGRVPNERAFLEDFAPLRRNAKHVVRRPGTYLPGLFISTAHGSRGLTSAPICAELIASMLFGETAPLERSLLRAVSPARFLIRDLCRNKL